MSSRFSNSAKQPTLHWGGQSGRGVRAIGIRGPLAPGARSIAPPRPTPFWQFRGAPVRGTICGVVCYCLQLTNTVPTVLCSIRMSGDEIAPVTHWYVFLGNFKLDTSRPCLGSIYRWSVRSGCLEAATKRRRAAMIHITNLDLERVICSDKKRFYDSVQFCVSVSIISTPSSDPERCFSHWLGLCKISAKGLSHIK